MSAIVGIVLWILSLVFAVPIAVLGAKRLKYWWTMRRLDPSETVVETGLEEIRGKARAIDGMATAPYSETETLVCDWRVERRKVQRNSSNWMLFSSGSETVPFEVEHGGPAVAVDPEDAQYLLQTEFEVDSKKDDDLPPEVQTFIEENSHGEEETMWVGDRHRFIEKRLDPGGDVDVIGPVERDARDTPGGSSARFSIAPEYDGWLSKRLGEPFLIGNKDHQKTQRRQFKSGILMFVFGSLLAIAPGALLAQAML